MKHILTVLGLTAIACWTLAFTGCVIPALTGIKEIESDKEKTTYRFMTGADFSIGLNGIDRVDNKRGIAPKE